MSTYFPNSRHYGIWRCAELVLLSLWNVLSVLVLTFLWKCMSANMFVGRLPLRFDEQLPASFWCAFSFAPHCRLALVGSHFGLMPSCSPRWTRPAKKKHVQQTHKQSSDSQPVTASKSLLCCFFLPGRLLLSLHYTLQKLRRGIDRQASRLPSCIKPTWVAASTNNGCSSAIRVTACLVPLGN